MQPQTGTTYQGIDPGMSEVNYIASSIAPEPMRKAGIIVNIIIIVFGWLSVTLEVFTRYDFGERALSWLRLFFPFSILFMSFVLYNRLLSAFFGQSPLFMVFALAFVILSIWHRIRIWLRYRANIPWHSMSIGTSRLADLNLPYVGDDDWALFRWYEPILWFAVGFVLARLDSFTGSFIQVAAVAMLVKNHLIYYHMRSRILDLIDARIESIYYNEEAYGKHKQDVAGISVVNVIWPKLPDAPAGAASMNETLNATMGSSRPPVPVENVSPVAAKGADVTTAADLSSTLAETLNSLPDNNVP